MTATVINMDCRAGMGTLPANSVDAIVTDPPYGLSKQPNMREVLKHWLAGDDYTATGGGFMGKKWDSFVPGPLTWEQAYRVLKPGGYCAVFAGSRTVDLMATSLRLAGFEVVDMLHWMYGSGFPKSLNIGKALDKLNGKPSHPGDEWRAYLKERAGTAGVTQRAVDVAFGTNGMAGHWFGASQPEWPTLAKYNVLKAMLQMDCRFDADVLTAEAQREVVGQKVGTVLRIAPGAGREHERATLDITAPATDEAKQWDGWGTALKPCHEPIILCRKPLDGTYANNIMSHGVGALNIDGCRVTGDRWPGNVLHDGCLPEPMDRYFYCAKASKADRNAGLDDFELHGAGEVTGGRADGSAGLDSPRSGAGRTSGAKNIHPTVKPTELMRWLCRLVTPPGGMVLDPFTGSGSTGRGAVLEGFNFLGFELGADYAAIAEARIKECEQLDG